MSGEETTEKQASARDQIVLDHGTAVKVFSSPQVDFGLELPPDFEPNLRALGQIYDVIQRFLIGDSRRGERYYPTTEDIYGDLQIFKRSISDKVPMPTEEDFRRLLRILAATNPPFLHFLRELSMGTSGVEVVSSYTAPTEKHPDKVMVGYQSALRNSSNVLKDLLYGSALYVNWEERCKTLHSLDDLGLRKHRVDYFLKQLYIQDPAIKHADFDERLRLKKINEHINRFIYRPLIQQLYRDKTVLSFSCKDIRAAGHPAVERYSDLLLFNNPEQLQKRYLAVRQVLDSHLCLDLLDRSHVEGLRARKEAGEDDFFVELGAHGVARALASDPLHEELFDLAVEVQKLAEWHRVYARQHREKKEKEEIAAMIERVRQHGDLVRVNPRRKTAFKEEHLRLVLSGKIPALLWITEPPFYGERGETPEPHDFEFVFLLYRDRSTTGTAIQSALKLYESGDDPYLVLLLDRLLRLDETSPHELKKYVPPIYLEKLKAAVNATYADQLPWLLRLWYKITSTEIDEEKVARIKQRKKLEETRSRAAARKVSEIEEKKSARKQVKSVARSRVQEEDRVLDALKTTIQLINKQWQRGHFPTRTDIEDEAPEEGREAVQKVLGLVDAGAASVRAIRKIRLPSQTDIYAGEDFLKEHQAEIVRLCQRHSAAEHVAVNDGVERTLHDPTRKRAQVAYTPDDFKAVLRHVQTVS